MKNLLVSTVLAVGFLIMPGIAMASFFDDSGGKWYMNPSWWELEVFDSENRTSLVDQNNRLEWITTPGWADGYEASRGYASKWAFDFTQDFEFNVGFHYDDKGSADPADAGINFGLFYFAQDGDKSVGIGVTYDRLNETTGETIKVYDVKTGIWGEDAVEVVWPRALNDGLLRVSYDAQHEGGRGELQFQALERDGDNWKVTGDVEFDGLNAYTNKFQVYLEGWSDGSSFAGGDAYFQNFNVIKGTMTPEPLSCALFLLGGGTLFTVRRLRKRV